MSKKQVVGRDPQGDSGARRKEGKGEHRFGPTDTAGPHERTNRGPQHGHSNVGQAGAYRKGEPRSKKNAKQADEILKDITKDARAHAEKLDGVAGTRKAKS